MLFRNQGADVRSALAPLILNPLSCEHCLSLCCCCWLLSHVRLFATPWTAAHQASLFFTISRSLLKLMSIELVMPSDHHHHHHLILCHPPSPLAFNISQDQGLFQWVGSSCQALRVSIGVSASVSVLPMNIQGWFLLGWTGLIALQAQGLSTVFSTTPVRKPQFFSPQPSLCAAVENSITSIINTINH